MSDAIVPLDHQLLRADEVAELLRLPVSTIYDLARTDRLPDLKIGRALRFPERVINRHRPPAHPRSRPRPSPSRSPKLARPFEPIGHMTTG
jgi:excisionase family DNA binding protein